jgi:hypothetical protein
MKLLLLCEALKQFRESVTSFWGLIFAPCSEDLYLKKHFMLITDCEK